MTGPADPAFLWEFRCEQFVFARLAEAQTAAAQLPPGERELAIALWSALTFVAAEHTIYVDAKPGNDGIQSAGRCYTCSPVHGVPCTTMCRLARIWAHHADYRPAWNEYLENVRGTLVLDTWDVVASAGFWNMRLRDYEAAACTCPDQYKQFPMDPRHDPTECPLGRIQVFTLPRSESP